MTIEDLYDLELIEVLQEQATDSNRPFPRFLFSKFKTTPGERNISWQKWQNVSHSTKMATRSLLGGPIMH